jgi:hypothetical protein
LAFSNEDNLFKLMTAYFTKEIIMKGNLVFTLALVVALMACSKKEKDDTSVDPQTDIFVAMAQSAADEATESIAESGSSSSFQPLSNDIEPLTSTGTITRDCNQIDTVVSTATVTSGSVNLTFAGTDSVNFSRTLNSSTLDVTLNVAKAGTENRVWTPATCLGNYANVDWSNYASIGSLTLTINLSRAIDRSGTVTITKANGNTETRNLTDELDVVGSRLITWSTPTTSSGTITLNKSIVSSVTRARSFTRLNGATATGSETVTVGTANPLLVTVYRNSTGLGLISKTITGGQVSVTKSDGSVSKCTFSNVLFSFANSNSYKCLPKSGSITCEKFASGANTTPDSTVVITFGASTNTGVSYSVDGATDEDFKTYNVRGCDLEKAS